MSTSFFFLVSDIFERTIENQTSEYVEHRLNLLLCGFQKADSVKLAPLKFLSSWQNGVDKLGPGLVCTILMTSQRHFQLSSFFYSSLKLINTYIASRK